MRIPKYLGILSFFIFMISYCTLNYVKDEDLRSLDEEFKGTYIVLKDIETAHNEYLNKGTRVRLYFLSGRNSVKVYAYDPDEKREGALGKLILYMFDTDFPDKVFLKELMVKRLSGLVKRVAN